MRASSPAAAGSVARNSCLPIFGTLIGYLERGEPQVGVIHFPAMGETVYASKGSGCWVRVRGENAKQVKVSATTELRQAFVDKRAPRFHGR